MLQSVMILDLCLEKSENLLTKVQKLDVNEFLVVLLFMVDLLSIITVRINFIAIE